MTREDAKSRWCFKSMASEGGESFNRVYEGDPPSDCMCLAERCMAWVERAGYNGAVVGRCGLVQE